MEQVGNIKFYTLDEVTDEIWGKIGTPERDAMEARLKAEIDAWHVGEAIRKARLQQSLSQEQLGERIGVKRSQISKLERGKCVITLPTMSRVFRALGVVSASLDLGAAGKVALW